jgi:hypothetical protein
VSSARIGRRLRLLRRVRAGRHRRRGLLDVADRRSCFHPGVGRQRLQESRAVDLLEFKHEPGGLAICRVQHVGVGNPCRSGQIEHNPRAAGHHQAIPKCLDQPTAFPANPRTKLKTDLGNIEDHAVGIGKRERVERD